MICEYGERWEMAKVSVIIPVYNHYEYLVESIRSVRAQTYPDWELLVVDDGTWCGASEIRQICGQEGARLIAQENRGPSGARNTGIRATQGEYVAFLDADDIFLPEKLCRQASYLDSHPEIGVVYSDGFLFRYSGATMERRPLLDSGYLDANLGGPHTNAKHLALRNALPIHAALVRRDCLEDVGLFDESVQAFEDWDLWYRLGTRYSFAYLAGCVAGYRVTGQNISADSPRMLEGKQKVMAKIAQSEAFAALSPEVQAEFYYQWSMVLLRLGLADEAIRRCSSSVRADKRHWRGWCALSLMHLLGLRALPVYSLKEKVLGVRGHRRGAPAWSPTRPGRREACQSHAHTPSFTPRQSDSP